MSVQSQSDPFAASPPRSGMDQAAAGSKDTDPAWSAVVAPETFSHGAPVELFSQMRTHGSVVWVNEPGFDGMPGGPGFWAVLGHAECGAVLRQPRLFSSRLGLTQIYDAPPPLLDVYRSMMINMDPPEHTRLHRIVAKSFTPRAVAALERGIVERCRSLVADVSAYPGQGACDFARDVVAELPLLTLADMLGMPESDRWLMFDWANRVIGMMDAEYGVSKSFDPSMASGIARQAFAARPEPDAHGRMPDARHPSGMADLYVYARGLAAHLRSHPGDDVMSLLLRRIDDGDQVSVEEFENIFWLFCVAGNETVRNAIPGGMQALLEHPDEMALLWRDPTLINGAVEEMLRWWSPVVHFRRTATTATDLGGQRIEPGDKVVVFFSAANRDPAVFDDPDRFDITRTPNPHIAFGTGPHFCIGAMLARTQMRAMLREIISRWESVEQAAPAVRLRASFQHGIKSQPVRFVVRSEPLDIPAGTP